MAEIDVEIDYLTQSVVHQASNLSFSTHIVRWSELRSYQKKGLTGWRFDWSKEAAEPSRAVVGLFVEGVDRIQGLISFEPEVGYIHAYLIESAPHNVGHNKMYRGVPGNLFANLCSRSLDLGFEGVVAFDAKTELIGHYTLSLGAEQLGRSSRMVLEKDAALRLVERYFAEKDQWPL